MRRVVILGGALVLGACGLAACSGDDNTPLTPQGDAGQDTGAIVKPDASIPNEGGTDSGAADTGATDGALTDGPLTDGSDANAPLYAMFVATNYSNAAELSVVTLNPDSVAGRLPIADQDSVPFASGGFGFILEHTMGKTIVLDHAQPWKAHATIDINDSPDAMGTSNPRTVLVTTGTKAYVARYASNTVKIVDVASGAVTPSVIDLSQFMAQDDTDGLVDVQDGAYDPVTKRAYFLLERIDQTDFTGSAPDYVGACLASHGQIVAVDVTTDAIVDLNGAAAGNALDLLGDNPASLTPDFAGGRFIVPESGCYEKDDGGAADGGTSRRGRGVESVAIATATPTWLFQTTDVRRLSGLLWIDATHAYVNQGSDWSAWDPTQSAPPSNPIVGFPLAPLYDGAGRIVGIEVTAPDAGSDAGSTWSVVAWNIAAKQLSTIATSPFQSVVPLAVSSALLR